jgi:hypothetical protein
MRALPVAATMGVVKLAVNGGRAKVALAGRSHVYLTSVAAHRSDDEESTHGGDQTA